MIELNGGGKIKSESKTKMLLFCKCEILGCIILQHTYPNAPDITVTLSTYLCIYSKNEKNRKENSRKNY